jgi:Fic family protein
MIYRLGMNEIILENLRKELLTRSPLEDLPEGVWKRAGALNTWGTNAIEGNTLTWHDVERLLLADRSVGNRPRRDVLETIQHDAAFRSLLSRRQKPVTLATALELHEAVFRGILPDAGQWRRVNVRIAGTKHVPPRMERVLDSMEKWVEEYNRRDTVGEGVFFLAAWTHHEFESIHPFSDGNGRVGRLLLNLHFLKHDWPPVHILPPDRESYLSCLEVAHTGNLAKLEDFLRTMMASSLLDLLDQVGTKDDELKPLKAFAAKGPYSAQYLSLRAGQSVLPAVMIRGDWHTSQRALQLYRCEFGRELRPTKKRR